MALDNRRPALDRAIGALRAQERRRRGGQALALRVMRGVRAETLPGPLLPLDDPTQDLRISGARPPRSCAERPTPSPGCVPSGAG